MRNPGNTVSSRSTKAPVVESNRAASFKYRMAHLKGAVMFPNDASLFQSVERWFTVSRRHVCPGTLNISPCQECLQEHVGTLCTNRSPLPFKGKTREAVCSHSPNHGEWGTDVLSAVLSDVHFSAFSPLLMRSWLLLRFSVLILINSVPLKLAKVYTKHLIWQKATSACFGWDVKLFVGYTFVQPVCKQYFSCNFAESS